MNKRQKLIRRILNLKSRVNKCMQDATVVEWAKKNHTHTYTQKSFGKFSGIYFSWHAVVVVFVAVCVGCWMLNVSCIYFHFLLAKNKCRFLHKHAKISKYLWAIKYTADDYWTRAFPLQECKHYGNYATKQDISLVNGKT